jgi:hypothetical protein
MKRTFCVVSEAAVEGEHPHYPADVADREPSKAAIRMIVLRSIPLNRSYVWILVARRQTSLSDP